MRTSLLHIGYALIPAMMLAGFLWDQPVYKRQLWRMKTFYYRQYPEKLKFHCRDCEEVFTVKSGVLKHLGTVDKLEIFLDKHECDAFELLCRGIRPPIAFRGTQGWWDGHWSKVYEATEIVANRFPGRIVPTSSGVTTRQYMESGLQSQKRQSKIGKASKR